MLTLESLDIVPTFDEEMTTVQENLNRLSVNINKVNMVEKSCKDSESNNDDLFPMTLASGKKL